MPSSKGEPTDPELREKVKEEVKAESKGPDVPSPIAQCRTSDLTDIIGGGPGKWSAWKAGEMAKRYEAEGGDYTDTGGECSYLPRNGMAERGCELIELVARQ
jgi:hypothetical protein